mgnify:CR=1 FL=1
MSDRKNVLMICTDHWSGSLLGCAGRKDIMTPTLDYLANNGIRYENFYSECPVCIPARRSMMTGLTPMETGRMRTECQCQMFQLWRKHFGKMVIRPWQ